MSMPTTNENFGDQLVHRAIEKKLEYLPEVIVLRVIQYLVAEEAVDIESFLSIQSANKFFHALSNSRAAWYRIPVILSNGQINLNAIKLMKKKSLGTEGACYQVYSRSHQREYALKRARVYPDNEGVPYYMMREIAALKKIKHPNISELLLISLKDFKLYLFFPYVETTLHDYINPSGEPSLGRPLLKHQIHSITRQLLSAVAHIHRRGIMHRNLKPKHVLIIPGNGSDPLDNAVVKLADFALVRILGHPPKKFTSEVITLWYRPPEILMGQRDYSSCVDMWSLGCIYAEMLQGKPLFTGLCEIDQLFQIFFKLGTPNRNNWILFEEMPNYQDSIFPIWTQNHLHGHVTNADDLDYSLLQHLLRYEPHDRISAEEALLHPCMRRNITTSNTTSSSSSSTSSKASNSNTLSNGTIGNITGRGGSGLIGFRSGGNDATIGRGESGYDIDDTLLENVNENQALLNQGLINVHKNTIKHYLFLKQLEIVSLGIHSNSHNNSSSTTSGAGSTSTNRKSIGRRINGSSGSGVVDPFVLGGGVSATSRASLVDWLIEVLDLFDHHMCLRTAYFAVALIDKYLYISSQSGGEVVESTNYDLLRLLGATCLHIASKCEDVSYIGIKDLANQSEGRPFEPKQILLMEEVVLNRLNFDVYLPTDFLSLFIECISELKESPRIQSYAKYLAELSLLVNDFLLYRPSMIAASAAFLAFHTDNKPPWPKPLSALCGYSPADMQECLAKLHTAQLNVTAISESIVYTRYLRASNHEVATWSCRPPPSLNILLSLGK